ncbi:MAG: DUF5681 domain-containing protein [Gammaproteobacteria bacterium]
MAFKKGQSGNPDGRPQGSEDKRTVYRKLLEPHAPALMQKAVDLALEGDTTALRLCLERIAPPIRAKDEPVTLALPVKATLTEQGQALLRAMAEGVLSPVEAGALIGALAAQARLVEVDELEKRLQALEARVSEGEV